MDTTTDEMTLEDALEIIRTRAGNLSRERIAEMVDVFPSTLGTWMRQKDPRWPRDAQAIHRLQFIAWILLQLHRTGCAGSVRDWFYSSRHLGLDGRRPADLIRHGQGRTVVEYFARF